MLLRVLLWRLKRKDTPIVRTLHNLTPHENSERRERRLLDKLDQQVVLYIRLSEATPLEGRRALTILHGHYRGRYKGTDGIRAEIGKLLYFGLIRPYKGVETLLEVFTGIYDNELKLHLVGKPDKGFRELIEAYCRRDPRISSELAFVPDDRLAQNILAAELIILPYKEMHNSGALLVALSLSRPVLVPRSRNNELLAEEVGPGWIHMFEGDLTEKILRDCLANVRKSTLPPPRLDGRDWDVVGESHYQAYRTARTLLHHSHSL
jgi:beta-1,4-mannosyltransferase